ncbi:MAG TPA: DegV family protein [Dehalococcoidia bacterium]|jgi:DegV family protein with EDD domain
MIKVVTDSTADLPVGIAGELGIEVLPVYIILNDKSFRDGMDMNTDEFYQRLVSAEVLPTTSQPTIADFQNIYNKLASQCQGIVSVHISSKISGTYNTALQAVKSLKGNCPVEVIDSQFNSIGLGLVVIGAARMAKAGKNLKEVAREAKLAISQVRMLGVFDTLKYVIAGGRINKSVGSILSILNIKPMLTFKNGEVVRAGVARTYSKAMEKLIEFVKRNLPVQDLAIVHSAAFAAAEKLKQELGKIFPEDRILVNQLGAALGVHGGPGMILIALRKAPTNPT